MKAKLFMARLLAVVMLLNCVLPTYAAVNTLEGAAVETTVEDESTQYRTETDSEAEMSEPELVIEEEFSDFLEVQVDASDFPDNEELLNGFIESLFYGNGGDVAFFDGYGLEELEGFDGNLYAELHNAVYYIATGEENVSAVVKVNMNRTYTVDGLGVSSVLEGDGFSQEVYDALTPDFEKVYDLLLVNCPYELYWMDKTKDSTINIDFKLSYDGNVIDTDGTVITVTFPVAEDYQDENDSQLVNTAKVTVAIKAEEYASDIAYAAAEEFSDDFEVAERLKEEICALAEYNTEAADASNSVAYGDPWQMVYVFDQDNTTKVVCEGYAKAFQFLCDRAGIECYTVTGTMTSVQNGSTSSGPHMWNIVILDDVNYLVDVTNCDGVEGASSGNAIGFPNYLFLAGVNGSVAEGYTVAIEDVGATVEYEYDDDTKALYSDGILTLSDKSYYDVLEEGEIEPGVGFDGLQLWTGGEWGRDGKYFTYVVNGNTVAYCFVETDGNISFIDKNGYMVTGFYDFGDGTRYFDDDGFMVMGTSTTIDGELYTFAGDGCLVEDPPYTFTKHPKNQVGVPGMTVTFKVETEIMEGSYPSVQWMYKVDDAWEEVEGATRETLTVEVTAENQDYRYRCKLYSETEGLKLYSNTVRAKDTGWGEYEDGKWRRYEGGTMVTGWYEDEEGKFYLAESDEAIEGLLTGDLAIGLRTIDGKLYYFAEEDRDTYVLGALWTEGAVEVDGVIYTVNEDGTLTRSESDFAISKQPGSYWGQGDVIQFTVETIGADSYKWEYSTDGGTTWADVTDAQGTNFNTKVLTVVWPTDEEDDIENYWYRCEVKSGESSIYSNVAQIHITSVPIVQGTWVDLGSGLQCFDEDGDTYEEAFAVYKEEIYYLDEEGYMATEQFIEYASGTKTHLYYVDDTGVLATNKWISFVDEYDNKTYWRYMLGNGRAAKSTKKVFVEGDIEKSYAFDSDAIMMTGWVTKDTETAELVYADDWKTAEFYYSESEIQSECGVRASGLTTIKVDENEEYTFYFSKSNGEKCTNKENYDIDGTLYNINADGVVTKVSEGDSTGSGSGGSVEVNTFTDMAGLQELVGDADESDRILVYTGSSDFVISADLTVPSYINLQFNGNNLVINKGVTFTINDWIECGDLTVNGTMNANGHINAGDSLSVNGTLNSPQYNVSVKYPAMITGLENIVFGDESEEHHWMQVMMEAPFETVEQLKELSDAIANDSYQNEERVGYKLQLSGEHNNFEIDQEITVPAHARLELCNAGFVIVTSQGTLINEGELNILVPLEVFGILTNNGVLSVSHDTDWEATLSLRDGGAYYGNGEFQVHTDETISGLDEVLFGFDLADMYFRSNTESDGITHWWLDRSDDIFTTFEKLVSMAASDEISSDRWRYVGTEPLVIKNTLSLPEGVGLDMNGMDLTVPSGVTFTVSGNVDCANLVVEGTMNASEWIHAEESVTVSGTLNADRALNAGSLLEITETGLLKVTDSSVNIDYQGEVIGMERIQFANEWQEVIFVAQFKDDSDLADIAEWLSDENNCMDHERAHYMINMQWINEDEATVTTNINKNITIPAHAELQLNSNRKIVVENGATLTIDGRLYLGAPLTVNGSLVNNGQIYVNNYPNDSRPADAGTITLKSGEAFSGNGSFFVNVDSGVASIAAVLFGFNLDKYDISEDVWDNGNKQWQLKDSSGLIKLGTPKNLKWGIEYREEWVPVAGSEDDYDVVLHAFERNGSMSWETVTPDQAEVQIHIYREGETTPCHSGRWGFGEDHQPEARSVDNFRIGDLDSGTYYFTVQSLGDYITYCDSDVATSELYTYVKPSEKMDKVTGLNWVDKDDNFVTWIDWEDLTGTEFVDGYQVEIYYSDTVDGEYEQFSGMRGFGNPNTEDPLDDHFLQEKGAGYYKFKVRALSKDIETIGNGRWSAFSPVFDTTRTTEQVNDDLTDIIDNVANNTTMTQDDILNAVQSVDTQELKTALLVDQDNTGATEKLADLEQAVGGPATVEVTPDASAFNVQDVSIVGANLNSNAENVTEPIKLVVDKPEEDHVIPELYNSSVAVSFSMELENVEDPKNLDVPVKITLPIPSSINPEFVVILHYDVYGDHEIIHPYVYNEGGKWYADFVLTSFSDFVMTTIHELERVEAKPATETSKGNIEHYVCECCGAFFADAEATEELTREEVEIPALSHTCQWDDGVVETPSTCTTAGKIKYSCTVDGCEEIRYEDIPAAHTLVKVAAKEATYSEAGNIEHYKCTVCGKLFADAAWSEELTLAEVTIPKKVTTGGGSSSGGGGGSSSGGGGSSSGGGGSSSGGGGGSSSGGGGGSGKAPVSGTTSLPSYVVDGQWAVVNGQWTFTDSTGLAYVNKWAAVANPYANVAAGQSPFDWFYFDGNGQMATSWVLDNGLWYYLNAASDGTQGRMFIGLQTIGDKQYYFNPVSDGTRGAMLTGWQMINGKYYYFEPAAGANQGAMVKDAWIGTYYVDASGVWDQTK